LEHIENGGTYGSDTYINN